MFFGLHRHQLPNLQQKQIVVQLVKKTTNYVDVKRNTSSRSMLHFNSNTGARTLIGTGQPHPSNLLSEGKKQVNTNVKKKDELSDLI